MRGSNVDGTTKFGARSFYKADFSGATLHRVKGYKGKFNFTKWENATIINSCFSDARFYKANFDGVDFSDSDMRYTNFGESSWKGATVTGVDFKGSNFNSFGRSTKMGTASFARCRP